MTAASIKAAGATGYADYLESKTIAPQTGDYYLGHDGVPAEAPGRWIGDPDALERVGITPGPVQPDELRALIEGRRPALGAAGEPVWLRNPGPDGTRAGGLDITFSAPKGVSVAWALGEDRAAIEAAHEHAIDAALGYLRESVELTVRYDPAARTVPDAAAHLHAASFTHTTARGVGDTVPDPQLHTHVVITSVERHDGSSAAVRSRPVFRAAREIGAFYRAHLAEELRDLGYEIEPAGKDGRYFAIRGISEKVEQAFSKRTAEVRGAIREFRARYGRDPERGELRDMALKTRSRKQLPRDRAELDRAWTETGKAVNVDRDAIDRARHERRAPAAGPERWAERVEVAATARRAIFTDAEPRTAALESAAVAGLAPRDALAAREELRNDGRVLDLADGRMTTRLVRESEQDIDRRLHGMAGDRAQAIDSAARERGIATVEQRLGGELFPEQRHAVETITGPGRASVLIGPAGTGKGVVIDAAAQAEREAGREVYGVAVAGRTAQRLGEASPALEGRTRTIDSFVTALDAGRLHVDHRTTVYVDEAGMGDTARLAPLVAAVDERGGRLVAIGDHRQLPAIGAGGMFEHAAGTVPTAELAEVRRTQDPATREAWRELRDGDPAKAMAHFYARGDLRFADTREQAVERAARRYDELAREHGHQHVTLMSDASNVEIDTLNLRVQQLRHERGELTPEAVEHPDGHRLHGNDRIVWTEPMRLDGQGPRVENGQQGTITTADPDSGRLTVRLDAGPDVQLGGEQVGSLRLAYAAHITREQGATVREGVALTGGWQTSREGVYVQASRASDRIEFHISREDLNSPDDEQRVRQLAARVERSDAQTPSISQPLHDPYRDPGDQHGRERVERYRPPRPPERTPAPTIDRTPEIAP
ncbi:MAG TPA: MobF family relaxase [Conexibacter sp.]|nr:MobF family relaxase [Conexibacter sp.]